MPDHAHARLALRRLVSGLIAGRDDLHHQTANGGESLASALTIDETLARLDTTEADDLRAVFDFIDDTAHERPRFCYVAKDRDYQTGAARGLLVLDLANVDAHNCEAELMATAPGESYARTLTNTLNEHPPVPPTPAYDDEPF